MNCTYCGSERVALFDHFVPKSKNGSDAHDNLIPCCKICNSRKSDIVFSDLEQAVWAMNDDKIRSLFWRKRNLEIKIDNLYEEYKNQLVSERGTK